MPTLDSLDILFINATFLFQMMLSNHFALRRRHFEIAIRYGQFVYGLSLPAAVVSLTLLAGRFSLPCLENVWILD